MSAIREIPSDVNGVPCVAHVRSWDPGATPGSGPWLCARLAYVCCCLEGSAWPQVHVLNSGQMVGVGALRTDHGINSASVSEGAPC